MLSPNSLLESVRRHRDSDLNALAVFWYQVRTDRTRFMQEIESLKGDLALACLPVPAQGFDNANAILSDLSRLISENREYLEATLAGSARGGRPATVLLLSRTEFEIAQVSSPMEMPDWFPSIGGQTVQLTIEDLTHTAAGPLNVSEARIKDLCERLYSLESVLVKRLTQVHQLKPSCLMSFFDRVKDGESCEDFLTAADAHLRAVSNPQGYRPSARGRSLVARILRQVTSSSPDQLGRCAKSLSDALRITEEGISGPGPSMVAVLLRPTQSDNLACTSFARNLIVAVYATSQFVTASAHADGYPSYPIELVRQTSLDLRSALESYAECLEGLPVPD